MNREEARRLLGRRVSAWTAMNGSYVGKLVEILEPAGAPWRGRVRIDGVLEVWCLFEGGRGRQRKGLNLGQVYEFGGTNVEPAADDLRGMTKLEALKDEIKECERWLAIPDEACGRVTRNKNVPRQIIAEARRQIAGIIQADSIAAHP